MPRDTRPRRRARDTLVSTRRSLLRTLGAGVVGSATVSSVRAESDRSGDGVASAGAGIDLSSGMEVTLVPANPDAGFNYPYFLFAPPVLTAAERPLLVEPNNTGTTSDEFGRHRSEAAELLHTGFARELSEVLRVPLLVPVFPRPREDPVDWRHNVHSLDTETMRIDGGPLERVDRQLIRMVEDAQRRLGTGGYPVADRILMDGFSSSAKFVNRFTALHPELVHSVSAGAFSGTAILPLSEAEGHRLNYQVGVADVERLTGDPFDRERFCDVDQFLYLGAEDENDPLPNDDTWNDEQRRVAYDVYGRDMQADRFPYSRSVYDDVGASATFELYDGLGHRLAPAMKWDVVRFHLESLNGGVGASAYFEEVAAVAGLAGTGWVAHHLRKRIGDGDDASGGDAPPSDEAADGDDTRR